MRAAHCCFDGFGHFFFGRKDLSRDPHNFPRSFRSIFAVIVHSLHNDIQETMTMMMLRVLSLVLVLLTTTTKTRVDAFLFQYKPVEGLANIAEQVGSGTKLEIQLSVGQNLKADKLSLTGLSLELMDEQPTTATNAKRSLPSADGGPNARLSSGARLAKILELPSYITLEGKQSVQLEDACWEVVWRDEAPGGHLVCGFHLPCSATRNQATLSAGNLLLTIPLWTQEGLAAEQVRQFEIEDLCRKHLEKRDEELAKMQQTSNLLEKAWHYRNAAEAAEMYYITSPTIKHHVPDGDDAIPIQGGYLLSNKGIAWTRKGLQRMQVGEATLRRSESSETDTLGI